MVDSRPARVHILYGFAPRRYMLTSWLPQFFKDLGVSVANVGFFAVMLARGESVIT